MSTSSMKIVPEFPFSLSSISLKRASRTELLPAPVRPTIPTLALGLILKLRFTKEGSRSGLYLRVTYLNKIKPFCIQE